MERLRRVSELTPQQTADWETFKEHWDAVMAKATGEGWGEMFAQIMEKIGDELAQGKKNALSMHMHRETLRVLQATPALRVPGM